MSGRPALGFLLAVPARTAPGRVVTPLGNPEEFTPVTPPPTATTPREMPVPRTDDSPPPPVATPLKSEPLTMPPRKTSETRIAEFLATVPDGGATASEIAAGTGLGLAQVYGPLSVARRRGKFRSIGEGASGTRWFVNDKNAPPQRLAKPTPVRQRLRAILADAEMTVDALEAALAPEGISRTQIRDALRMGLAAGAFGCRKRGADNVWTATKQARPGSGKAAEKDSAPAGALERTARPSQPPAAQTSAPDKTQPCHIVLVDSAITTARVTPDVMKVIRSIVELTTREATLTP